MLGGRLEQGVAHTEECMRKREANMCEGKDPRFERSFDNRMKEDEETMSRNMNSRQVAEERESRKRTWIGRSSGNARDLERPAAASSSSHVSGEGAARQGNPAGQPDVGTSIERTEAGARPQTRGSI